jgi:uncharacterized protein
MTLAKWSAALRRMVLPPRTPVRRRFLLSARLSSSAAWSAALSPGLSTDFSHGTALGLVLTASLLLTACQKTPEEPAAATTSAPTVFVVPPRAASAATVAPSKPTGPACPPDPEPDAQLPTAPLRFASGPSLTVELAKTSHDTERGLMYRTSMPEDHGMLFYLGERDDHAFWMRNTCIPLDMLFVDELGTIVGILEEVPILNEAPRSVGRMSTHVLEVNAGWCKRHGIKAGQKLFFPTLSK